MTLDPEANRYVKYIRNIRTIQVTYKPALVMLKTSLSGRVAGTQHADDAFLLTSAKTVVWILRCNRHRCPPSVLGTLHRAPVLLHMLHTLHNQHKVCISLSPRVHNESYKGYSTTG